ncbi:hypothetical protein [Saccharomonospora glauca]|jgi:hypothetical protein|uniref:Uncharacterized protein n=1 Tax=Saccharomonospora glauca K62 TaxID=928724 RepID=I1CYR9_9PSEU|nr:hypothetical protein [Saccharomonospora glauca]EIE97843.1 hypothetical protein SacglDRAFT_00905 [Saccharomonospora glauca K62]
MAAAPGLYTKEIRTSLRNNSGAFGYSVMITCALAMLSAQHSSPNPLQIMLFALGAVLSFLVVEAVATNVFRRSLGGEEQTKVIALGSSIAVLSVGLALGATAAVGAWLPATVAWLVGSFVASTVYLLLNAVEMVLARRVEETRRLA